MLDKIFTDKIKGAAWLLESNPHFGGASPLLLILSDRGHKVIEFIKLKKQELQK